MTSLSAAVLNRIEASYRPQNNERCFDVVAQTVADML